jgi:hypothetical protein
VTRSIMRSCRAGVLLVGAAAAATLLLSGCSAGQIAQTAAKASAIPGVNADLNTADGTYQIRNLLITYKDTKPYPVGANAPLSVAIFNVTGKEVTVKVTTDGARSVVLARSGATPTPTQPAATSTPSVGPSPTPSNTLQPSEGATESQSPRATGSPQPVPSATVQAPSGAPATFRIPANSFIVLNPSVGNFLQLEGLNAALRTGQKVNLVFDFDGKQLTAGAPVSPPLSPAPVASPVNKDAQGGHGG